MVPLETLKGVARGHIGFHSLTAADGENLAPPCPRNDSAIRVLDGARFPPSTVGQTVLSEN